MGNRKFHLVNSLLAFALPITSLASTHPPFGPPIKPTTFLEIRTAEGNATTIYGNGEMQAKLIVNYELSSGFHSPIINIKEKYSGNDLPDTWRVSASANGYLHVISNYNYSAASYSSGSSFNANRISENRYVSSSSPSSIINACVELTAIDSNGTSYTDSTCYEATNADMVRISSTRPIVYTEERFTMTYVRNDEGYNTDVRYYELVPDSNINQAFEVVNACHFPSQGSSSFIRIPNESGELSSSPTYAFLYKSTDTLGGKAHFVELLAPNVNRYVSEHSRNWDLDTSSSSNRTAVKMAVSRVTGALNITASSCSSWYCQDSMLDYEPIWPLTEGGQNVNRTSFSVILKDDYGTEHPLSFSIRSWELYFGNTKVW